MESLIKDIILYAVILLIGVIWHGQSKRIDKLELKVSSLLSKEDVEVKQERVNSTLNRTVSIAQEKAKDIANVTSCQVYKIEQAFNELNEVFEEEEA